jgi:transcriptional regulator with XRE-family HTH domain
MSKPRGERLPRRFCLSGYQPPATRRSPSKDTLQAASVKQKRTDARFYHDLGRSIRLLRQAAGESQTGVAAHLDVTFQQVQKYENGSNRIPVDRLIALSKYLDIPHSRFFDFMELPTNDDELNGLMRTLTAPEFRLLLRSWKTLKSADRTTILNLVIRLSAR